MKRVNFEQAKRLCGVGYDGHHSWVYHRNTGRKNHKSNCINWNRTDVRKNKYYVAPTLHEVCDWLREDHGLHVNVDIDNIEYTGKWMVVVQHIHENNHIDVFWVTEDDDPYDTFHEAQLAGIDRALDILGSTSSDRRPQD